jgi:hypothetical protein
VSAVPMGAKVSKQFFFEKKNQKAHVEPIGAKGSKDGCYFETLFFLSAARLMKGFLVLFYKKELLALFATDYP